jgi:hypothetical protein
MDQYVRLGENLQAYGGPMWLGSLTAPGADALATPELVTIWNEQATVNWRLLNAHTQKLVRRELGYAASLLAWIWEKQHRGALHKHFLLGVGTARERHAATRYLHYMDQLRAVYGFGFMDRGRRIAGQGSTRRLRDMTGLHAARYVAKYLMKRDQAGEHEVLELVKHRDVPPLIVYVSRKLTERTGVTMRWLREKRHLHAVAQPVSMEVLRDLLGATYGHDQVDDVLAAVAAGNAPPSLAE